ncbi:glutaredoxin domain-containing protein [Microbacterium sp. NPDC006705]|uniref:glutaredoxin domain-containing protein n=1 Tax=Microbacterium sp. NPDC006705 TaxID=3364181 RepID=UPI00384DA5B3
MGATTTGRVTVFSREGCVQCNATYRALDGHGVDYRIVDVDELREGAAEELRALGFTRLPVVKVPGTSAWSGFRPDLIAEIDKRAILPSDATREARSPAR